MIRPSKSHKSFKYTRSKNLQKNLAMHPFVMIGLMAALVLIALVAVAWRFWAK